MEIFMDRNFLEAEAAYLSAEVRNLYDLGKRFDMPEYCWRAAEAANEGGAADGNSSD